MKLSNWTKLLSYCIAIFSIAASLSLSDCHNLTVLYAQSLPATVHVVWTPSVVDSSHPAPVQYSVVTDNGTPVIVQASICTTICSVAVQINSYGGHSTVVSAQNYMIDSDPSTIQSTPAAPKVWVLNQSSNSPTNTTVKN